MKNNSIIAKKDVLVLSGCVVFVLANLGAVGSTGRRRAKEAVCLSNLRQWGVIWKFYTDDNDGFWGDREAMGDWMYIAEPYYKNRKMLLCPEATRLIGEGARWPFGAWTVTDSPPVTLRFDSSYCVNLWCANQDPGEWNFEKYWRTPYVGDAAYAPLLLDGNWKGALPYPDDEAPEYDGYSWEPNANEMKRVCINRHRGAVNGVFLDFSARKIGLKELWKLKWHRKWPAEGGFPSGGWPPWMQNFRGY